MTGIPPQLVPDDRPADARDTVVLHNVKFGAIRSTRGDLVPTFTLIGCGTNGTGVREIVFVLGDEEAWHELSAALAHHAGHAFGSGGFASFVDPTMN